jgi:hypothetical protein
LRKQSMGELGMTGHILTEPWQRVGHPPLSLMS